MHGWRGAHAWCVRDERALHVCARVQGAEQRARAWQWRGEARCATCLFVRFFLLKSKGAKGAKTRSVHKYISHAALNFSAANLAALVLLGTEAA